MRNAECPRAEGKQVQGQIKVASVLQEMECRIAEVFVDAARIHPGERLGAPLPFYDWTQLEEPHLSTLEMVPPALLRLLSKVNLGST